MAVFEKDSKVYAIGGQIEHSTSFDSDVVYELSSGGDDDHRGLLVPCVEAIPKLPSPMPHPIVAKIKGETYVLYCSRQSREVEQDMHNCFLLLKKDEEVKVKVKGKPNCCYEWRPLPPPPFYLEQNSCRSSFRGVVANKLCVESGDVRFSYDVERNRWKEEAISPRGRRKYGSCPITLSIDVVPSCYVVMCIDEYYIPYDEWDRTKVETFAALVDSEGNLLRRQVVSDALPGNGGGNGIGYYKAIELEEEEEEEEEEGIGVRGSSSSSIVCLVYIVNASRIAFSVVRVSFILEQLENITSSSSEGGDANFLEVDVLEKRQYAMEVLNTSDIHSVFFC